jgi:hypothetical protein
VRVGTTAIVASAFVVIAQTNASAAVRSCAPGFAGELTRAATEVAGKTQALASWTAKAQRIGPGYTNWRLADKKVLACTKAKGSAAGFECIAYAAPCTIAQVPSNPKRRKVPSGRNAPFEV